jgi:hypothetical protein
MGMHQIIFLPFQCCVTLQQYHTYHFTLVSSQQKETKNTSKRVKQKLFLKVQVKLSVNDKFTAHIF